ncbi:hypothetical protein [Kitasatospora sp. NPDC058190]|uniref:hypothetical protein n=1 Tax=Kitasatospora sp. NPDC058190 TaxID=3346371 RepID=UPI0036DBC760
MSKGQVSRLRHAVTWVDQHPVVWLTSAFPVSYQVQNWELQLEESRLDATPPAPLDEDEALAAILPILNGWKAFLEVEQRLLVTFRYLGAEPVNLPSPGSGPLQVQAVDILVTVSDAEIEVQHGALPEPSWDWAETAATVPALELCLRPLRNGSRPVVDAAYWLVTHLIQWAEGEKEAADQLNVAGAYFAKVKRLSGRSDERKVGPAKGSVEQLSKPVDLLAGLARR